MINHYGKVAVWANIVLFLLGILKMSYNGDVAAPKITNLIDVRAWPATPFAWTFV